MFCKVGMTQMEFDSYNEGSIEDDRQDDKDRGRAVVLEFAVFLVFLLILLYDCIASSGSDSYKPLEQ